MSWACVLLPSLALDGALRQRPQPEQAFALVCGSLQQRRLVAVNAAAHAAGLRPGQRLAEAEALCSNLLAEVHRPQRVAADLALVAAWAYRFSSQVALVPPRAIVLEVGKSLGLFGPWPRFAARLRNELTELGFRHRLALAPNPCAAKVLAGAQEDACVMDAAALAGALAGIRVAQAGLPAAAIQSLPNMGIRNLGQLLALPRAGLQRRFGNALPLTLERLLGQRPHAFAAWQPPERFEARIDMPASITSHAMLLFPLKRLLGDLATHVAMRDGGVQQFVVQLGHEHAAPTDIAIGLLAPQREDVVLFEIAKLRLERTTLSQPVASLGIIATTLPPLVPEGRDLFDTRPAHAVPWEHLCERLRARLGDAVVHGLAVDPDPRPERASLHGPPDACADGLPLPPRPAWLLARPIPLRGPAPRILAGPERIEAGWWDGGDIRRDYYIIETVVGQRAWVFSPPGERGPYMLHGWFA